MALWTQNNDTQYNNKNKAFSIKGTSGWYHSHLYGSTVPRITTLSITIMNATLSINGTQHSKSLFWLISKPFLWLCGTQNSNTQHNTKEFNTQHKWQSGSAAIILCNITNTFVALWPPRIATLSIAIGNVTPSIKGMFGRYPNHWYGFHYTQNNDTHHKWH